MKLREIERLRALAVLMVVGHHWDVVREAFPPILRGGWTGVDLFFVISGFVVTRSILKLFPAFEAATTFAEAFEVARNALKVFYARRFFRILPAALTVALLHGLIGYFYPDIFGKTEEWWRELVAVLTTYYSYTKGIVNYAQLGQYWSLSTEEHFYLILPMLLIAWRTPSGRLRACLVVGMFSIACRALSHPERDVGHLSQYERMCSHFRFDSFMPGVMMALVERKESSPAILPRRFTQWVIVPATFLLLWALPRSANDYINNRFGGILAWGLAAILVGYASLDEGYVFEAPGLRRVLEYFGSRSYAIYLVHIDVPRIDDLLRRKYSAYAAAVPTSHHLRQGVVLFLMMLVLSELVYRAVELPVIKLGLSRIRAFQAATAKTPRSACEGNAREAAAAGMPATVAFRAE